MYMVIHGAKSVGICEKPRWVSPKGEFGCFIQVPEEEATHVAIGGVAYDLKETSVKEVDGGEVAFAQMGESELLAARLDYVAMMADVDIDETEERNGEEENG